MCFFLLSVRWCERTANSLLNWILVDEEKAGPCRSNCLVQLNLCTTPKQTICSRCLATLTAIPNTYNAAHTTKNTRTHHRWTMKKENKNVVSTLGPAHTTFNRHTQHAYSLKPKHTFKLRTDWKRAIQQQWKHTDFHTTVRNRCMYTNTSDSKNKNKTKKRRTHTKRERMRYKNICSISNETVRWLHHYRACIKHT